MVVLMQNFDQLSVHLPSMLPQGVVCDGPVEKVLNQLFSSIHSTLQRHLSKVVSKHFQNQVLEEEGHIEFKALSTLPSVLNSSSMVSQLGLLLTQLVVDTCLQEALSSNDHSLLSRLQEHLNTAIATVCSSLAGRGDGGEQSMSRPSSQITHGEGPVQDRTSEDSQQALDTRSSSVQQGFVAAMPPLSRRYMAERTIMILSSTAAKVDV